MGTKRRGWGERSIFQRKTDGQWVGTIELGRDYRGRRRRRVVYGRTKRDVLDKLDEARSDKRKGLEPIDQGLTTGQWLDLWLSDHCPDLSEGSLTTNRQAVESYIRPEVGHIRLAKLTPADIERMGRQIRQRGLSANTAKVRTASSVLPCRWPSATASCTATSPPSRQAPNATIAGRIRLALEAVLDERPFDADSDDDAGRLGSAYTLYSDRDLLQIMMHGLLGRRRRRDRRAQPSLHGRHLPDCAPHGMGPGAMP